MNESQQQARSTAGLINNARRMLEEGETEAFSKTLASIPRPWPSMAHQMEGIFHARHGRFAQAAQSFEAALATTPNDADLWNNLALARYQCNDWQGAAKAARLAIGLKPDHADAHNHLGIALSALGVLKEAEVAYRGCLRLAPRHPLATNNLAKLALDHDDAEQGLYWAELACAFAPDHGIAHLNRGAALERLGRSADALLAYHQALSCNPQLDLAYRAYLRIADTWNRPLAGKHVILNRCGPQDCDFLGRCFTDESFMARFHRHANAFPTNQAVLQNMLAQSAAANPVDVGEVSWTVRSHGGEPIGLIDLAGIDLFHRRAELLVGFPDPKHQRRGLALEATLLVIEFSFLRIGLEKLTCLVYGDNPEAQSNAVRLGFREEGKFIQHIRLADGRRLDVWQNGLLATETISNNRLNALANRLLGRCFKH